MRLIDADKLYPDCLTNDGRLAISQSQIANAPTVIEDVETQLLGAELHGIKIGYEEAQKKMTQLQSERFDDIESKGEKIMIDKIKQAVADEFKYRASQGRTIYSAEAVIYIVNEVIDEIDWEGESKTTSTTKVNLDCWQNEPILLTSNPPKLLWKCRFCGKEITTDVSELPTTPCNCLKENKVMPQDQPSDVDMQIRIIKGDLQYLSEKVDKLSSLIEELKIRR